MWVPNGRIDPVAKAPPRIISTPRGNPARIPPKPPIPLPIPNPPPIGKAIGGGVEVVDADVEVPEVEVPEVEVPKVELPAGINGRDRQAPMGNLDEPAEGFDTGEACEVIGGEMKFVGAGTLVELEELEELEAPCDPGFPGDPGAPPPNWNPIRSSLLAIR
jgi:hypothetical protein